MSGLEYNIQLAEHGRLAGELLLVGNYSRGDGIGVDMQTKKIVWHTFVGDANGTSLHDLKELSMKATSPVPRMFKSHYPNEDARVIPLDFFMIEYGQDIHHEFPDADIVEVKGESLARVYIYPGRSKGDMMRTFSLEREKLGIVSRIFIEYEVIYSSGTISINFMKRTERNMWLPGYWFRTRRIEKKRRQVENAAFKGGKGDARKLKNELDAMIERLNKRASATQSP